VVRQDDKCGAALTRRNHQTRSHQLSPRPRKLVVHGAVREEVVKGDRSCSADCGR